MILNTYDQLSHLYEAKTFGTPIDNLRDLREIERLTREPIPDGE
ncbi:hypothetical protein [Domibacillus iocasae]|nr:hypothetical protein [Domibacillus iocasae]